MSKDPTIVRLAPDQLNALLDAIRFAAEHVADAVAINAVPDGTVTNSMAKLDTTTKDRFDSLKEYEP